MTTDQTQSWRPRQAAERAKARRAQPDRIARRVSGLRESQAGGAGASRRRRASGTTRLRV